MLSTWNWNYSCELPRGCWGLNLGPLQEQLVLMAEPSLQLPQLNVKIELHMCISCVCISVYVNSGMCKPPCTNRRTTMVDLSLLSHLRHSLSSAAYS